MENVKKTPYYECHLKSNGKVVDYSGWALAIEYSGIISEHNAVRTNAGLFDVSHMGEILVKGDNAAKFINYAITNNVEKMVDNKVMYTMICKDDGGILDDLLIYRFNYNKYMIVANAANIDKVFAHLCTLEPMGCSVENISSKVAQLALQGPNAQKILQKLTDTDLSAVKYYTFQIGKVADVECLISRTGYTGEDGFEVYSWASEGICLWDKILDAGLDDGLVPTGLGCRDTLRFEAAMPLYGHEMSETVNPLEVGIGFAVKFDKDDFIGKVALQSISSPKRVRIGIEMIDRGIAREGYPVFAGDTQIGNITSGSFSPTLKKNLGMALVDANFANMGDLFVEIRGKKLACKQVPLPFYKRNK